MQQKEFLRVVARFCRPISHKNRGGLDKPESLSVLRRDDAYKHATPIATRGNYHRQKHFAFLYVYFEAYARLFAPLFFLSCHPCLVMCSRRLACWPRP